MTVINTVIAALATLVIVIVAALVDYWINFRSKGNKHVKVWKKK